MIMEITELMVGDIVQYLDGKKLITVVVVKVDGSGNVVRLKQKNGHKFNTTIDFLKPIPLTRNILKSNGWSPVEGVCASILRHNGYNLSILHWAKPGVNLTIDKGGYGPNLVCIPIYYVHELQNALRLCKINKQISLP